MPERTSTSGRSDGENAVPSTIGSADQDLSPAEQRRASAVPLAPPCPSWCTVAGHKADPAAWDETQQGHDGRVSGAKTCSRTVDVAQGAEGVVTVVLDRDAGNEPGPNGVREEFIGDPHVYLLAREGHPRLTLEQAGELARLLRAAGDTAGRPS